YTTTSTLTVCIVLSSFSLFFFNAPSTTAIYTLSLHDALPISVGALQRGAEVLDRVADALLLLKNEGEQLAPGGHVRTRGDHFIRDRKSTRLNSSHVAISYAVFCLKKKTTKIWSTLSRRLLRTI